MKDFWNQRFAAPAYAYGEAPNEFFRMQLHRLLPGRILLPAEGEGRNAVYAAQRGWQVQAYDFSEAARNKALQLAEKSGVSIHYELASHQEADFPTAYFDVVALIFAHTSEREHLHQKAVQWLRPGGTLILQGFSKEQLQYVSGGPRDPALLFDRRTLESDFRMLAELRLEEVVVELEEGHYPRGLGALINLVGKKPV